MRSTFPPSTTTGYQHYHAAFSSDLGHSFSKPKFIPNAGCVRPKLQLLSATGPMLLSGGRDCVDRTVDLLLWIDGSGTGRGPWTRHSVSGLHNRMWQGDPSLLFPPSINDTSNIFAATNGYTSLVPIKDREVLLMYTRQWARPPGARLDPSVGFSMRITLE